MIILPDWDGSVIQSAGLHNVNHQDGLAVINRDGEIFGVHQGDELGITALDLLEMVV